MSSNTLGAIRTKVRRLTRSPSSAQITDTQLDEYVNTFILYDFPEQLRVFSLKTTFDFYTTPYVDIYQTSTVATDPLYNFKNKYTSVSGPVYIAGVQGSLYQDRSLFFAGWSSVSAISDTTIRGNGTTGPYAGTLKAGAGYPVLQNNVVFTAVDANGNAMVLVDYPSTTSPLIGYLGIPGEEQTTAAAHGQIAYTTGIFTATFSNIVPDGTIIYSETIPYQVGKPTSILYFDSKFTVRPVPDKAYKIRIAVDARPTELIEATQAPDLEQWWQYIAYGAAIKIFQDRFDNESVQAVYPEFQRQEDMVSRRSNMQQINEGVQTIYSTPKRTGMNWWT